MSAERNNPIIKTQSGDHGGFAGQACELDGPKVYGRGSAVEDPNAGRASVIEHSSERLTVPHRDVLQRRFVLTPLVELDGELTLPDGTRLRDALERLEGQRVERVGPL